jgi:hypothetical protein
MLLNQEAEFVKVTFEIELFPPVKEGKFDFKELVSFLDSTEHIHEHAIMFSLGNNNFNESKERKLLEPYSFCLEDVFLKENLSITLSFNIHIDSIFPYYFALKILLKVCETYGSNIDKLHESIENLLLCLQNFLKDKIFLRRRIGPKTMDLIFNHEQSDYFGEIEKLLNNPQFKRLYESFCKTALTFKKITALFEFLDMNESDILIEN